MKSLKIPHLCSAPIMLVLPHFSKSTTTIKVNIPTRSTYFEAENNSQGTDYSTNHRTQEDESELTNSDS
jgi:hypothetical protein